MSARGGDQFVEWATAIPTARGSQLDFESFPYQRELYRVCGDLEIENVVIMKGAQLGVSELLTRFALYCPDKLGLKSLYVFPTATHMRDFGDTRIRPLIDQSTYLSERVDSPLNKNLIKIGLGFIQLRGSESRRDLIAIDADLVILDEYDDLVPENVPDAEKRIAASPVGLVRRVGVPRYADYGIAARYSESDMRQWMVRCDACLARWQPIEFWRNVAWSEEDGKLTDAQIVCYECRKHLDVSRGEWVPEHRGRDIVGFHLHRLVVPSRRSLLEVVRNAKRTAPYEVEAFWRTDLGQPYAAEDSGLDRTAVAAAVSSSTSWNDGQPLKMVHRYDGPNFVTMGVDVASTRALNVRISEHIDDIRDPGMTGRHRKRMLWAGNLASFDELPGLMHRYGVTVACIDHLPEYRLSMGFAQRFPGRVYVTSYSQNQKDPLYISSEDLTASVQRTPALDATVELVRCHRNLLAADITPEYVEHLVRPRRIVEKNEYGLHTVKWLEKGPTDFFHAEVFDLVATEVLKIRLDYFRQLQPQYTTLDELIGFERTRLDAPGMGDYDPGPPDEYDPGPPDEYDPGPRG
jgi:Phage terminase large subunit (GpA)